MFSGDTRQSDPRIDRELGVDMPEMRVDRVSRQEELGRRFAICVALRDEIGDPPLGIGEAVPAEPSAARGRRVAVDAESNDRADNSLSVIDRFALGDRSQSRDEAKG